MKKFLYLFFFLPFGQIFAQEEYQRPVHQEAMHPEEEDIDSQTLFKAFDQQIEKGSVVGLDRLMPTQRVPTPRRGFPQPPFLLEQQAQSFTLGQHQLTTGANSFSFQMPSQLPAQVQSQSTIILKGRPVQHQLPAAAAPITAFSSPAAPALLPALTVSIPSLPTTVEPIRTTANENKSHEPHQVEGFRINTDGNYQCMHPGCNEIMDSTAHRDSLNRHQRTHRISYQCSQCGYDGKGRQDNVKRHIDSKEGKCSSAVVKTVILKESNVQVVTPDGFTRTPDGNYQCMHPRCKNKTISGNAQIGTLKRHQKMHINEDREKFPGAAVETVTSSSAIGDDIGNEAPFLPPFSPPSLPTFSSAIARLPDQHKEQGPNRDDAFIAQLLSEPLPRTLGFPSVMPGPSNSQGSDQSPALLAPQITQGQEVENRFGIQHAPAPSANLTLSVDLDLDQAFIDELLSEQSQQGFPNSQFQQQQSFTVSSNLLPYQITPPQTFSGQQPFTVGSFPAANFLPSQEIPPQPFSGQQLSTFPPANLFSYPITQPQPQQSSTVGSSVQHIILDRLSRTEAFMKSYSYQSLRDDQKQKALQYFTELLGGSMAPVTQTIGSAPSNVSPVDLPPIDLPTAPIVAALAQKISFQCELCERSFASELILKRHRASEHTPQLLQKNTSGSAAREDHSTDVSVTAAQSDEGPGEFNDFIKKFSSTTTGPDGKKIYCCTFPNCRRKGFDKLKFPLDDNTFRRHMKSHFSKLGKKHECKECKKSFITKGSLDRHLNNDNVHQLRLPSERSSINLPDKYKKHFTQEDSKIICKKCGKEFPSTITQTSLYQHTKTHQEEYQCSHCKLTYRYSFDAKKHTRKNGSCKNAEIKVINLTSTAPSASNQQEFSDDDDDDHDDYDIVIDD